MSKPATKNPFSPVSRRVFANGGMDKLVDENGPRRKDWGYGTLNRRMLLMVIAGLLSGPAKSKQKE